MDKSLIDYFQYNHDLKDDEGNPFYAPTTMRTWVSVFQAFYLHTNRGVLKNKIPIINTKLDQWEKLHS